MSARKEEFLAEILTEGALWLSGVGTPKPNDEEFDELFPSRASDGWLELGGGVAVEGMTGNERFAQIYAIRDADGYIEELRIKFDVIQRVPAAERLPHENESTPEDMYWVRLKNREVGPIGKLELFVLFSSGKITLDTQIAIDSDSPEREYRKLSDEIPALKKT